MIESPEQRRKDDADARKFFATLADEDRDSAAISDAHRAALSAAQRCGIREGETLAELIQRLYSETLADD